MIAGVRSMILGVTVAMLAVAPVGRVTAQAAAPGDTGRSAATGNAWVRAQSVTSAPLRRTIDLELDQVTVQQAITEIAKRGRLRIGYDGTVIASDARVSLHGAGLTVNEALATALRGTGLEAYVSMASGQVVVRAAPQPAPQPVTAPTGTIVGQVTDAATGEPVVGADVRVVETQTAATANDSGRYVLPNVPAGEQTATAQRIGYETETQSVTVPEGGVVTLDFALGAMATRLNELVVTVTGEQRVREVGNVVARIRADSLTSLAPVMSFSDLIQGRAPGVFSMTSSNKAGQAGAIRLRGLNSFGVPNDPIVVVDGVRVEATAATAGQAATSAGSIFGSTLETSASGGFTGRLADFEPNEIASVEIVKGPSAATLYGTDAANGVLVITTKRGRPGRTRWSVFTEQGLLQQRLEDWGALWGGSPSYAFGHSTSTGSPQRCTLLQRAANGCVLDSLVSFNALTDPATRPFKDGRRQQYGLQASGGTPGGATYFLSGDYEQETGTLYMPAVDQALIRVQQGRAAADWQERPNAYERVNLRANLTAPLGARGSMTLATGFVSNQARQGDAPVDQVGYRDLNDGWVNDTRPAYFFSERKEDVVRRFLGSLATTYTVRDWLTLRGTAGVDVSTNAYGQLLRRGEGFPPATSTGRRTANELNIARYSLDFGATATHALSAAVSAKTSVGVQYNRRTQRGTTMQATNLPLGGETLAGGTISGQPAEATLTTTVAGGYLEEVVGLKDRLFLTGALRFDGGSAFGEDFAVTAYPKANLSWLVTDGQAGPDLPGVSSLRLRAAYGASGVQPGPIAALQQLQVFSGVAGTTAGPAAILGAFGNPGLEPERTSELEAGLDLELAAGRVRLEFTAYQRTSQAALVNRALATSVGGGTRWENLGSVRNRGLELLLGADLLRGRPLSAGLTLTGSLNENRLRRLAEGVIVSNPASQDVRQDVGYPLFGWWGRTVQSYADANGNGILELSEVTITENQFIGPGFPTREATAAPYMALFGERLRLSGLLHYRGGLYGPSFESLVACAFHLACRAVNDASAPLADQARFVAFQLGGLGTYTEPRSYLLLRELSASLTVPPAWGRVIGAREARLVLAARNVALLWRQGATSTAPENSRAYSDRSSAGTTGPSTYWLLRLHVNY